jgi:adenine-specific DNA-methyltransferase
VSHAPQLLQSKPEKLGVQAQAPSGDDPHDALRRALKAEIDETAWAGLNSTISRPFARPKHGRICVKVVNHFGDEVQKVFFV